MQNQEILNQEEHQQQLPTIASIFNSIYSGNSKEISYGDAYQSVYKLCKKGMSEDILNQLTTVSNSKFSSIFQTLHQQQNLITHLISLLKHTRESMQKILEVLLYIETNYFQGVKRQHKSIEDLLNSLLFEQLCANKQLINKISKEIVELRIKQNDQQISQIVQLINILDDKQIFFLNYLSPVYCEMMSKYYQRQSTENYEKMELKQFLIATKQNLQKERKWLTEYFLRTRGKKTIEQVMKKLFEAAVNEQKQMIYLEKSDQLFQKNTMQFLDLMNEKKDQDEITQHNNWFISQIKIFLNKLDKTDNAKFLTQFIKYYQKIGQSLGNTKTYNIRYKVIFYFEQWINDQKINLPKRLNIYTQEAMVKKISPQSCQQNFKVLFKLLKEKDYFEKEFRRAVTIRMIYQQYDEQLQDQIVKLMEEECGESWAEKINKMRGAKAETAKVSSKNIEEKVDFNPIVYEDTVWIMEKGKLHGQIPKSLEKIGSQFAKNYQAAFKGRKVTWHPFHGAVDLVITFNKCKKQFKMETGMASVLLYLQEFGNKTSLANLYDNSNYNKQQINNYITLLQKQKIILLDKPITQSSAIMTLNFDYLPSIEGVKDFTKKLTETILEHNDHEELRADRKMMVEALIVKIIKQSKVITLENMYTAITPLIETRGFQFNEKFVHNAFNTLIDKNYIRDLQDGSFSYIAS